MRGDMFRLSNVTLLLLCVALTPGCKSKASGESSDDRVTTGNSATVPPGQRFAKKKPGPYKPPANFVLYTDARVGFKVWAPRKPTAKITPLATPVGKTLAEEFNFGVEGADHVLLVTVTQLPVEKSAPLDAEGALVNARDGIRRKLSGKFTMDDKWNPKGKDGKPLPGREFRIEGKIGQSTVVAYLRSVVRDSFMYQVMAMHTRKAAASAKQGDSFVRSFALGARPKERKLLPPGALPVKIGTPTIEVKKKFRTQTYFLKISLSATVVQPLVPLELIFFKVWCKSGAIQKTFEHGSQGLRGVAAKVTKQLNVAPFLDKPLEAEPTVCQLDVNVRKAATNIANLGNFCFSQKKLTQGVCPK